MPLGKLAAIIALLALLLLSGCGRDDPHAALDAAAQRLQDSIEAKDTGALMALLHPEFVARQELDRDWVRRTAMLMFLRHRNVRVLVLTRRNWVDPIYSGRGYSEAQVALSGAEGLLVQQARHYSLRLEWWLEGDEWQLARLDWE